MAGEAQLALIIKGDVNDALKKLNQVEKETSGLGKTLGDVTKIAGGFLAANVIAGAGQKVMGFIGDSISAASELEQSVGGVNSIFKDSAGQILDWGDNNANAFGLSQRAFNQLATPLGAMLKNTGMSMDQVGGKTIDLTKRAADMAATFGGSVEEALTAVTAALRGETDPIERYGVSVNAAKVEAHALAMTGKTLTSSLTDQEKAAARLELIMLQTADAEGQFARESGTAAGKAEILKAKQEELQATLGKKLLPIQIAVTQAKLKMVELITTKVIPILEELYAKHWPAVQAAINSVVGFIRDAWPTIQPIFEFAKTHVVTQIEGMIQQIQGVVQVVTGVIDLVDALIHGDWSRAWEAANQILEGLLNIIQGTIKRMFGAIPGLILEALGDLGRLLYNIGADIINGLWNGMKDKWNDVKSWVGGLGSTIANLKGPIEKDRRLLLPQGRAIMQGLQEGMDTGFAGLVTPALRGYTSAIAGPADSRNYTTHNNQRSVRFYGTVINNFGVGGRQDGSELLLMRA